MRLIHAALFLMLLLFLLILVRSFFWGLLEPSDGLGGDWNAISLIDVFTYTVTALVSIFILTAAVGILGGGQGWGIFMFPKSSISGSLLGIASAILMFIILELIGKYTPLAVTRPIFGIFGSSDTSWDVWVPVLMFLSLGPLLWVIKAIDQC